MIRMYKKNLIKFTFAVLCLFSLLLITNIFANKNKNVLAQNITTIKKMHIKESKDNYVIDVSYPRYGNRKIDKIVTDYIYDYVFTFKNKCKDSKKINNLTIDYKLYNKSNYSNIFFNIKNSFNKESYKNILLNTKTNKESHISELYNEEELAKQIKELIDKKYSENVATTIDLKQLNNYTYYIDDTCLKVIFNETKAIKETYRPEIIIKRDNYIEEKIVYNKYVAFTFDDGPSENTINIVNALNEYGFNASFFMLGNRMKYNKDIVKRVVDSGNDVGSHSYSHKDFTKLNKVGIDTEYNSTEVIFNEITSKNIEYFRPPYGSYNNLVKSSVPNPIILWSVDTKDWLSRNAAQVSEHIINHVYDGSIVLLHDVYPSSVEALKMVLPELKEMGYKVVSVSQLAQIKNKVLSQGDVVRDIK
ncbi:MAG: polysaccharide deacetylase family protein [Bacilli bacterium]